MMKMNKKMWRMKKKNVFHPTIHPFSHGTDDFPREIKARDVNFDAIIIRSSVRTEGANCIFFSIGGETLRHSVLRNTNEVMLIVKKRGKG